MHEMAGFANLACGGSSQRAQPGLTAPDDARIMPIPAGFQAVMTCLRRDAMVMDTPIGAFEAKAQLSRLLREVERGERFTITVRGRPVADLVPHRSAQEAEIATAVEALLASTRVQGVPDAAVADFVKEGRR